jgi:radical SAM family uncharacterized protein/radical SAM-linked protein
MTAGSRPGKMMGHENLKSRLLNELLPRVQKPARYLGNELHSIHKDPDSVRLRVALFFPDFYELGLGNLGLHILYAILNTREDVWAERAYTPAPDMEALLREKDLPLFMLESKDALPAADLIGFTLQSELTYTNILNALDLAGIPLRSEGRDDRHPLIMAGGPCAMNPEPLAPFIDFFLIGDGEEAIHEIADALVPLRGAGRVEKLDALAEIEGVYIPGRRRADGRKVRRRIVRNLDAAPFPSEYIIPFIKPVHDGVPIEVMRGCTRGCRFCHAGIVNRPVRERSTDAAESLVRRSLDATGQENVSLVSLSTCDYSDACELVARAAAAAHPRGASVSLPSLRLDNFAVELADMVTGVRRSGLTFAPEAATPRMRAIINKYIRDDDLIEMAREAFRRGWTHIKTYFMIGLPMERDEDVEAIADLCLRTLEAGREITKRATIRTSVSTFVPKPFTPFQWAPQISLAETARRQALLADRFRKHPGINFGRHNPEASYIEGLLSRAGREAADLIEAAWRRGARHETNDDAVNPAAWREAVEATGYDAEAAMGVRNREETFPWDHIDAGVDRAWLWREWEKALRLELTPDCRAGRCHRCGIQQRHPGVCTVRSAEEAGPAEKPAETPQTLPEAPDPVQRIRFRIGRRGEARLLGHLELQTAWIRALRRAGAPMAHSKGFHAHPKLSFSTAAPLGEESEGDYLDVLLTDKRDPETLLAALRAELPHGILAMDAAEAPLKSPALMSVVSGFRYEIEVAEPDADLGDRVADLMARESLEVDREVKARGKKGKGGRPGRKTITLDIRPLITELAVTAAGEDRAVLIFETRKKADRIAKPREILALLRLPADRVIVRKKATFLDDCRDRA